MTRMPKKKHLIKWDSVGILTIESPLHYCSRMFPPINHSALAFYCVVALRLSYHRLVTGIGIGGVSWMVARECSFGTPLMLLHGKVSIVLLTAFNHLLVPPWPYPIR